MKKIFCVLSLIAILTSAAPAFASPPPPPLGGGPGGGHISAGPHRGHRPPPGHHRHYGPPPHRHVNAGIVVGGALARRSYWGYPYGCNYRIGWHDDFYYDYPYCRPYRPFYTGGIYIRF